MDSATSSQEGLMLPRFPGDHYANRSPEDLVIDCRCEMIPVRASEGKMHVTYIGGPQDGLEVPISDRGLVVPFFFFYTTAMHPSRVHFYIREHRGEEVVFCYAGLIDPKLAVEKVCRQRSSKPKR